ncbi:MAG: TROVE domain-containing protein [Acidobacteria bacterium]|nr:TROVE domain-containing protein [Acidobacteriota bacterium]
MANKSLFQSIIGNFIPKTDTFNEAGGNAYSFTPKHVLAQYAMTGCFNATFYASAENQLEKILEMSQNIEPEFIAKLALYSRERGFMKDMPALLCAILSIKNRDLLVKVFSRVIDNGKMLRNFVQIIRSGVVGRKSLGSLPKRLVREWFENRNEENIFRASIGQTPSFADIIKMVHPKPKDKEREAFFGYMIGRQYDETKLPGLVQQYEAFKAGKSEEMPKVPFEMLTMLNLSSKNWVEIARNGSWQMTRMNLNTFARHDVFKSLGMDKIIADRLRNPELITKAKAFPYQLMSAYLMTNSDVPKIVTEALQDAMEIAITNVPKFDGKIYICPDVSGSMSSPVTGYRQGSTSKVRCIDVAALVTAAVIRKNPDAEVLPFECNVVTNLKLNSRDSVMTNASKLASIGGGGTNCSAPLAMLNKNRAKGDLVIFVSDNESWVDAKAGRGSATMQEWQKFKQNNPNAKLVCIDIQPYGTTQAPDRQDILNIGGFSDQVFDVISLFANGQNQGEHWVKVIEAVEI